MNLTNNYIDQDRMLIAIECIIIGFDGADLNILLKENPFNGLSKHGTISHGFIKNEEDADSAARRIFKEITGLNNISIEQLGCFSKKLSGNNSCISIAYLGLINMENYSFSLMKKQHTKWINIEYFPSLITEYKEMMMITRRHISQRMNIHALAAELLPDKFTLCQLQNLYEAVLEVTFDKRNFCKKILSKGILKKLSIKEKAFSKKGSFYYTFNTDQTLQAKSLVW